MNAIEKLIKWEKDWASQQAYSAPKELAEQAAAELEAALRAIKTGVKNIPPEHSYGDWSTQKVDTLDKAKEIAAAFLNGEKKEG